MSLFIIIFLVFVARVVHCIRPLLKLIASISSLDYVTLMSQLDYDVAGFNRVKEDLWSCVFVVEESIFGFHLSLWNRCMDTLRIFIFQMQFVYNFLYYFCRQFSKLTYMVDKLLCEMEVSLVIALSLNEVAYIVLKLKIPSLFIFIG